MTEQWQELKETITEMRDNGGTGTQQDVCKFLANYMETLEKQMQQLTDAKETIIKSALKYLVKMQIEGGSVGFAVDNDPDHDVCWDDVLAWMEAQPSEDCIRRQAVLDVINFEDEWLFDAKSYNADTKIAFSAIKSKISELPSITPRRDLAETSQDCISRETVLEGLANIAKAKAKSDAQKSMMGRCMFFVEQLPPVKPKYTDEEIDKAQAVEQAYVDKMVELAVEEVKRPKGHWIIIDDCELFMAKCSECGEIVDSRMINKYPYCHCGAYMGGEDETN